MFRLYQQSMMPNHLKKKAEGMVPHQPDTKLDFRCPLDIDLNIQCSMCKRNVEGRGKGKGGGRKSRKEIGSEALAETEKRSQKPQQFFRFCQSFTSNFPSYFPFLFLQPCACALKRILCIYPQNNVCVVFNVGPQNTHAWAQISSYGLSSRGLENVREIPPKVENICVSFRPW